MEYCPVEIGEGVGRIDGNCLVHIPDCQFVLLLGGIETSPAHIAFRVETVQLYGFVVVFQRLKCVSKEEPGCPPVQIGGRVFGFLAYVFVEICHCGLEILGQEMGQSPAEKKSRVTRTEFDGLVYVFQGSLIISCAAFSYTSVMIA